MIDFEKIGKYEVTAKLGQGSFGVVYRGRDAYLKRDVAIKVCSVEDEGLRKRFLREAEIAGRLVHKNIVTVYEFGFESQIPFLVQELLSGEDLRGIIKRRAQLATASKLEMLAQVANGLGYAHSEGVIHRDIKPGNIRVLEDGRIKIMDFGIAKLASAETQLTQKGVTMGTASYLPPEQIRGSDLDHRADIFSFGVLAHELLTFERPFRGNTLSALVYQILYKIPQPMTSVWDECPQPLSDLIAKCLEKKPERRFESFAELIPPLTDFKDEVLVGKWPALLAAAGPEPEPRPEAQERSDVLSPGAITQTAKGVLEGRVGEYTISTALPAQTALRRSDSSDAGRSTQRIPVQPVETVVPETVVPETVAPGTVTSETAVPETVRAATPRTGARTAQPLGDPSAPPAGIQPAAGDALETRKLTADRIAEAAAAGAACLEGDLASTAHKISSLVAQGRLEAAKEQLEATISRKDLTAVSAPPPAKIAADLSSYDPIDAVHAAGESQPDGTAAGAAQARPREAALEAATASDVPVATKPLDMAKSDTYRTFFRPPLDRVKWAGLVAAAMLALTIVGWLVFWGGEQTPEDPVVEVPAPEPEPVAAATAPEPTVGAIAVHAVPWAEVTEITDAQGYLQELPEIAQTPFYLELPPGQYKVSLRHPVGEDVRTCDLEVTLDTVALCSPAFGETRVTDFFKESGWWR